MQITKHADARMNQRGITKKQLALVLKHGDPYGDKIVLSPKAARERINEMKCELKQLDAVARKGGVSAVMDGDTVITTYRTASYIGTARRKFEG